MKFLIPLLLLLCVAAQGQNLVPDDANSKISFQIRNFGLNVDGTFTGLKGTIKFTDTSPNSFIDVTVDASTIDTGIALRNKHLRDEDYFDVKQFPTLRFVSEKIVTSADGKGTANGTLTIKKTSKKVSIPFTYRLENGVPYFEGKFKIDRREFGVGGKSLSLSDEVNVTIAVRVKAAS